MVVRADAAALGALLALQCLLLAVVQPAGEFPINDDWAFAQGVQWLLHEGRLRVSGWAAMPLVPQTLAGAAVASVFGLSFEALRHVTQAASVLTVLCGYAFFRSVPMTASSAAAACVVLLAAPVWPVLANSFMTDLYGLLLALGASVAFVRLLHARTPGMLVAATVFSALGTLQRQVLLIIPLAYLITCLLRRRHGSAGKQWLADALPLAAAAAALLGFYRAFGGGHAGGVPPGHAVIYDRLGTHLRRLLSGDTVLWQWVGLNLVAITVSLGALLVAWFAWWGWPRAQPRVQRLAWAVAAAALAGVLLAMGWLPPYRGNVIEPLGIGPVILHDTVRGAARPGQPSPWFWAMWGVAAALGAVALVRLAGAGVAWVGRGRASPPVVFLGCCTIGYLLPIVLTDFFDRYLLFVLPWLMALWALSAPRASRPADERSGLRRALAAAWLGAALVAGAAATHDYFAIGRARWAAIDAARALGGSADTIDGGFEYNAAALHGQPGVPAAGKSWYFVRDDEFIVSFTPVASHAPQLAVTVDRWLKATPEHLLLSRRAPP